ncbi:MAG TPA: cell wall hydrolase [Vicinamibacterales bacterium]|nr:cell wall hydrolase [Vicinamibacterales bacterium]
MSTKREALAAIQERRLRRAREGPSAFIDGLFGFTSAPFQKRWHEEIAEHEQAVIWAPVEHGKTSQLSIGRPIWKLGVDPGEAGLIVSASATYAEECLGAIRQHIDENPWVRAVFPKLQALTGRHAVAPTIWGEARGERIEGLISVGCVVRNRVRHPRRWSRDWRRVCHQRWQFSCWLLQGGEANYRAVMSWARFFVNDGTLPNASV